MAFNCGNNSLFLQVRNHIVTQTFCMSFSPCACPTPAPDRYTFNFALSENPEKCTGVFAQDFSVEN